jgi:hypothetical protein
VNKLYRVTGTAVAALTLAASAAAFGAPYAAAQATAHHAAATPAAARPEPHPMIPAGGAPAPNAIGNIPTLRSRNWAGYAVGAPGVKFRKIKAHFFVPFLNCAVTPGNTTPGDFSSHWVGLDGLVSHTVEQDGIEADCSGGTAHYFAWREVFPRPEQPFFSLKIHPGDSITASVKFSRSSHKFRMEIRDNTTGRHRTVSQRCTGTTCKRNSAEVISEAPTVNGNQSSLADYGALSFAGISISANSGRGGIKSSHWRRFKIIQVGNNIHHIIARPTTLNGTAFANYWLGEN